MLLLSGEIPAFFFAPTINEDDFLFGGKSYA